MSQTSKNKALILILNKEEQLEFQTLRYQKKDLYDQFEEIEVEIVNSETFSEGHRTDSYDFAIVNLYGIPDDDVH